MSKSEPIRVLFLGKDAGRGGMQRELLSIVKFLNKELFSPLVLLHHGGPILPLYREQVRTEVWSELPEVSNRRIPSARSQRWIPQGLLERMYPEPGIDWAFSHARQFDPQIIVRQYMDPMKVYDALESFPVPKLQVFLMNGAQATRRSNTVLSWLTQHPVIYPGKGVRNFLEGCMGIPPSPAHEICTGLDLTVSKQQLSQPDRVQRSDLGINEDDLVIGTCGGIVFSKGTDLWVEAAAILRQRHPERRLKFLWIGGTDGEFQAVYGQSIQKLITRRGLKSDVIITGSQQEVYPYHALCDIYVQPSRDDAFPLATCEAMALSKPIVAFPQGIALEDYAEHAVIRVGEYSPTKLADAIASLIENPSEREARGVAARRVIEEHLDIRDTVRRYEALLFSTLGIAD